MQVSKAIKIWLEYHKSHSRDNTLKAYQVVLSNFNRKFGERDVREITSDEVLSFLNRIFSHHISRLRLCSIHLSLIC
ncbi:hypothetical protein ACFL7M_15500 [Thermodesulfobacteriota bacterium]